MSSAGTKVTTDPASNQEIKESVGVVTSDSLAAESLNEAGTFGEGNPQAAPSKQPSKSTTTNNTDTSGATTLAPAVDAEARQAEEGWNETQQLNAGQGLGKDAGVGPTYATDDASGYTGGSADASAAPTGGFAGAGDQARAPGELRPKGKNLTEDNELSGETAFGEIGTDDDPSRRAEQDFQARAAQSGADAGYPKDTSNQQGSGAFSSLGDETA